LPKSNQICPNLNHFCPIFVKNCPRERRCIPSTYVTDHCLL